MTAPVRSLTAFASRHTFAHSSIAPHTPAVLRRAGTVIAIKQYASQTGGVDHSRLSENNLDRGGNWGEGENGMARGVDPGNTIDGGKTEKGTLKRCSVDKGRDKLTAPRKPSRFERYLPRLSALSTRSGLPIPSLALSFAILHELTAIIPLVILFFAFQAGGVGISVMEYATRASADREDSVDDTRDDALGWREKLGDWIKEGEKRVDGVARRYGLFGYEKGAKPHDGTTPVIAVMDQVEEGQVKQIKGNKAAADIANAMAAYVVVKALVPVRIGASLAFAPGFTRYALEPFRKTIWHGVLRRPQRGI